MTSTDLAAWVQAIGSVGAIIAAILVAKRQFADALELQKQAAKAERDRRHEALRGLIEAALDEFTQVLAALRSPNPEAWFEQNSAHELMQEFHQAMQQISPLDMPSANGARALVKLRDLLATAAWNAKTALENGTADYDYFAACTVAMEDNLSEIRKEHGKLFAELVQLT